MKFIIDKLKLFIIKNRENKLILGRWNVDYCDKKINNKIDQSNEDHCGPCGQYLLNKLQQNSSLKKESLKKESLKKE